MLGVKRVGTVMKGKPTGTNGGSLNCNTKFNVNVFHGAEPPSRQGRSNSGNDSEKFQESNNKLLLLTVSAASSAFLVDVRQFSCICERSLHWSASL